VATGKAPISGSIAIVLGVLAVALLVIAIFDGVSWSTVVGVFLNFTIFVMVWRGAKKQDQEYQERMEHLGERLKGD
jgi:low temperature requirement protein LtrA